MVSYIADIETNIIANQANEIETCNLLLKDTHDSFSITLQNAKSVTKNFEFTL